MRKIVLALKSKMIYQWVRGKITEDNNYDIQFLDVLSLTWQSVHQMWTDNHSDVLHRQGSRDAAQSHRR